MQRFVEDRQIEFGEIDQMRVELAMLLSHAMKPFRHVSGRCGPVACCR